MKRICGWAVVVVDSIARTLQNIHTAKMSINCLLQMMSVFGWQMIRMIKMLFLMVC